MTRSSGAASPANLLLAFVLAIAFCAAANAADWQPVTGGGSQAQPQPSSGSGGSGSYGGIPTWGRGGGYSGEPDHPHPPISSAPTPVASCGLRFDPPTAPVGDYATVVATLPDAVLRDVGRIDLVVDGQVVAGATRQGGSFTYAFRVPGGVPSVEAGLTAYAARSGNFGQIRTLCTASASLTVMDLLLKGPAKVREGGLVSAAATVVGGQPPYRFEWFPSGRVQGSGGESTYFNDAGGAGRRKISVTVTDGAGRSLSRSKQFEVLACSALNVSGPQELRPGSPGMWTVTFPTPFPPSTLQYTYGEQRKSYYSNYGKAWTFSEMANPKATALIVTARDQDGCEAQVAFPVRVKAAPAPATRATPTYSGGCQDPQGCACPGGGRTWQVGQTCCGPVICQPGTRCVAQGECR